MNEKYAALYDNAYEMACQRAYEKGDVDLDYDYEIMEVWIEEYFIDLCNEEGLDPYKSDYVTK